MGNIPLSVTVVGYQVRKVMSSPDVNVKMLIETHVNPPPVLRMTN